jgi:hypothetical protein
MKISAKEVFSNNHEWIIIEVLSNLWDDRKFRIRAKRRFGRSSNNFYCDWLTPKYADKLAREYYQKPILDFKCVIRR